MEVVENVCCQGLIQPLGCNKKRLLKDKSTEPWQLFEVLLKDRIKHIEWIEECLNRNITVVCDRYKYSTYCYQSLHGIDEELMTENNALLSPDISFILYTQPDILLTRIDNRGDRKEIFETEDFLKRVVNKFLTLPGVFNERFKYINTKDNNDISLIILQKITTMFG